MLDVVLPQRCVVCAVHGAQLCAQCLLALPRIERPLCDRCGAPTAWPVRRCRECAGRRLAFAQARAAVVYDDGVQHVVSAWKERGLRKLAELAAGCVAEAVEPPVADVVTFVPPDPDRGRRRGHHPAAELARELAEAWSMPVAELLQRPDPLPPQRGLSRAERRRNVAGAFVARSAPRDVLLVDDVYTTGATLNAAAAALRRSGARAVRAVTFARAVR